MIGHSRTMASLICQVTRQGTSSSAWVQVHRITLSACHSATFSVFREPRIDGLSMQEEKANHKQKDQTRRATHQVVTTM